MHPFFAGGGLKAAVSELRQIDSGEQMLPFPEHYRRKRQMHLVNRPGHQELPDRGNSSADPHIATLRGLRGLA